MSDPFDKPCGCADCAAAVSPAAYLAALMDYGLKHLRTKANAKIDLPFLVSLLHQPFTDLPTDCEAVEKLVRQPRLCIEGLRGYVGTRPLADAAKEASLTAAEERYQLNVYTSLLNRIGTSYEEIRLARVGTDGARAALAERLGIDLTPPVAAAGPAADELERLFLESDVGASNDHDLTEEALESLFGLADTTRDRLSESTKRGDTNGQILRWNLAGAEWGHNTDPDGIVHVTLVNPAAGGFRVELYSDNNRATLVASGEIATSTGVVKLSPANASGLSGVVHLAFTAATAAITISAVPAFLAWRLGHLRRVWREQDHPPDRYAADAAQPLPIIDPDIIGPDDFRAPFTKTIGTDPDKAFDLWLRRRTFVDTTLAALDTLRKTKGLTEALQKALGDSSLPGNPLPDLDGLLSTITNGATLKEIDAARSRLTALGLTAEAFARLMAVRAKDRLVQSDPRNEAVTGEEWRELAAILTQVEKSKQFDAWRTEEQAAPIILGPEEFWSSLAEPQEGDWPPVVVATEPLIDPDRVKLAELPEWMSAKQALDLWTARKARLEQIPKELKAERESKGFDAMLRLALGTPPTNVLPHDLDTLQTTASSPTASVRDTAAAQIVNDLHLTLESFTRLMQVKAANDQTDAAKKPTAAEYDDVYAILTRPRKISHEYPEWLSAETSGGLVYWKALKARLPRWRASVEGRQAWRQALRVRSQPPIIDPEMMGPDDLRSLLPGNAAFDLWKARDTDHTALKDSYRDARLAPSSDAADLDGIIKAALGFEGTDLAILDVQRRAGNSVEKRLEQLNLSTGAFVFLMGLRGLASAAQPITDAEWELACASLARAHRQRRSAVFRQQEQDKGITLGPDWFTLATTLTTPLLYLDPSLPRWLSVQQARRDWQDTLDSRIQQAANVTDALTSAVSAAEESTLPLLRDALIQASDAPGASLAEQAEWITSRLLLDARAGGCQVTTRVAQAIETFQTLMFTLRTGQYQQVSASPVVLLADQFDREWKWLGSYATYRAATFVQLYCENVLQPSFITHQTPAFNGLVRNTRGVRLSPDKACDAAAAYADYFSDVCSLEIVATCQADTAVFPGRGCDRGQPAVRSMFYMFGLASSGRVYWSAVDAVASTGAYSQQFWREVDPLRGMTAERIVGAIPYRDMSGRGRHDLQVLNEFASTAPGKSHVYLFCTTTSSRTDIQVAKLSLDDFGVWGSLQALKVPPGISISGTLSILPVQSQSSVVRPALMFHVRNTDELYHRSLNTDGSDWDAGDWPQFLNKHPISSPTGDDRWQEVQAALWVNLDVWLILTERMGRAKAGIYNLRGHGRYIVVIRELGIGDEVIGALPGPEDAPGTPVSAAHSYDSDIYVFQRRTAGTCTYSHVTNPFAATTSSQDALSDLITVARHCGSGPKGHQMLAYTRQKNNQAAYAYKYTESRDRLIGVSTLRVVPRVQGPLDVPLHSSPAALQQRRLRIIDAFAMNADAPVSLLHHLHEAYYFVPMHLSLALQLAGYHVAALDGFRTVYDYDAPLGPPSQRNIYYGLELDAKTPLVPSYQLADGWLLDPLNPHAIASTRRYAYTRFTLMSIVRCLLAFADDEFTEDTSEALPRARTLYLTALELLALPELQQKLGVCEDVIAGLKIEPGKDVPAEVPAVVAALMEDLTTLSFGHEFLTELVNNVKAALSTGPSWRTKLDNARTIVATARESVPLPASTGSIVTDAAGRLRQKHADLLKDAALDDAVQQIGKALSVRIM